MKDLSKDILESERPNVSTDEAINHALEMLFRDNERITTDEVVSNLTFEELIGALLLARDQSE